MFNWLYSSNFDKILAIALGGLAVSVIWFAALDKWLFIDPKSSDFMRMSFLISVINFYTFNNIILVIGTIIYSILWKWELESGDWRRKAIGALYTMCVLFFIVSGALTSLGYFHPFRGPGDVSGIDHCIFGVIVVTLIFCIVVPISLIAIGARVTHAMEDEAARCMKKLLELLAAAPDQAKIGL